jgi:hypothetical protein
MGAEKDRRWGSAAAVTEWHLAALLSVNAQGPSVFPLRLAMFPPGWGSVDRQPLLPVPLSQSGAGGQGRDDGLGCFARRGWSVGRIQERIAGNR